MLLSIAQIMQVGTTGGISHNANTRMMMDTTKMLCIIKQMYSTHLPVVLNITVCHHLVCGDSDERNAQLDMDAETYWVGHDPHKFLSVRGELTSWS